MYQPDNNRYKITPYKRCGNSGLLLPSISLGLWHNFGHIDHLKEAKQMILFAFNNGICHFDLANNYGSPPGSAEENFGKILSQELRPYRDELIISTKAGHHMWEGPYGEWGSRKNLLSSLSQSLKRMKIDYVDIFYSHRYDPNTPLEETMGALSSAVKQGKALYVGISKYPPEKAKEAIKILRENGTPCLVHQVRYSLLVRYPEKELFDLHKENGIGCIAFSPLAQGLLSSRYLYGISQDSRAGKPNGFLHPEQVEKAKERIIKLNKIAEKRKQSLSQMAIAWQLANNRITSTLIGASSVEHIKENLQALKNTTLSNEELQLIDTITIPKENCMPSTP